MLNSLLHVSINGPAVSMPEAKEVVKTAVANWLHKKDTTSAATLEPVLVDQGTQCNSPAAPLNAEQLKLVEEQLQKEVTRTLIQTVILHGTA